MLCYLSIHSVECPLGARQALLYTLGAPWFPPSWSQQSEKGREKTRGIRQTAVNAKDGAGSYGQPNRALWVPQIRRHGKNHSRASSGYPCGTGKTGAFAHSPNVCWMPTVCQAMFQAVRTAMNITNKVPWSRRWTIHFRRNQCHGKNQGGLRVRGPLKRTKENLSEERVFELKY